MIRNKTNFLLILLVVIGLFIRIYGLYNVPNGFHDDELDAGYIGRYILLWGRDIKGNSWPLYYNKLGDFRPTGIFYLSGIFTFIFGTNEFAVRFPGAFLGALTIGVLYFFVNELTKNREISLWAAFLLMISPWHILLSRATSEGEIGSFFLLVGLTFSFRYIRTKKIINLVIMILSFFFSYFLYHTFRIMVPMVFFPLLFFNQNKDFTQKYIFLGLFLFFSLLSLGISLTSWGSGRFTQVAFFKNPILPNTIDKQIYGDGPGVGLHLLQTRILHNKVIIYGRELFTQYLSYFSPEFLYISGGLPFRFAVPESGLFYIITIPFIIAGLIFLFHEEISGFNKIYLLFLVLISPLAASLTFEDSPNVHRSVFLIIPITILTAIGINKIMSYSKSISKIVTTVFLVILSMEFIYFYHQYFIHSPSYKSILRRDGSMQIAKLMIKNKSSYDKIIMASAYDMGLYYLFYDQNFSEIEKDKIGYDNKIKFLDNIIFSDFECPTQKLDQFKTEGKKILFIDQGDCSFDPKKDTHLKLIDEVTRQDKTHAYRLLSFIR